MLYLNAFETCQNKRFLFGASIINEWNPGISFSSAHLTNLPPVSITCINSAGFSICISVTLRVISSPSTLSKYFDVFLDFITVLGVEDVIISASLPFESDLVEKFKPVFSSDLIPPIDTVMLDLNPDLFSSLKQYIFISFGIEGHNQEI